MNQDAEDSTQCFTLINEYSAYFQDKNAFSIYYSRNKKANYNPLRKFHVLT